MRPMSADGRGSKLITTAAWVASALSVVLYVVNTVRLNADTYRGDQWHWIANVLAPYEAGRIGFFDSITYEYENFAHSHIPTLVVFIANYKWFGLSTTVDSIVGVVSLLTTLAIIVRFARREMSPLVAAGSIAVVSAILFASTAATNFTWSLLQFQMLFVLVAIAYLASMVRQIEKPTWLHAGLVVPLTLIMGDASGAAAVAASLVYFVLETIRSPERRKLPLKHLVLFPVHLVWLQLLLGGRRPHSSAGIGDVFRNVGGMVEGFAYSVATTFVGLGNAANVFFLEWTWWPLWLVVGLVAIGAAALALFRSELQRRDHFPLMIMLMTLIWTAGVLKSRVPPNGAEAMQFPRYAIYTGLAGVGLALFLGVRWDALGGLRKVIGAGAAVVVASSVAASVALALDADGPARQDQELASLRSFAAGETDDLLVTGPECDDGICLSQTWFLADHQLGSLGEFDTGLPEWAGPLRDQIAGRFHAQSGEDKFGVCLVLPSIDDAAIIDGVFGDPQIVESVSIPDADRPAAEAFAIETSRSFCGGGG